MSLNVRVKKADRTYHEGEVVSGVVVVTSKGDLPHNGVTLTMEGSVNLQLSSKSVGVFEAFYNSIKPIDLFSYNVEIAKPGRFPNGTTEIPFEFPLKARNATTQLYETYHGVFINIQYNLKAEMKRSMLQKDLFKSIEFIVEDLPSSKNMNKDAVGENVDFVITPESLSSVKERHKVPKFKLRGNLSSACMCVMSPFTGELTVDMAAAPIKSIELQLIRVETCGCAEGFAKDATEIQNIQIADGNVCPGLTIPLYMVFPRLFTCPTLVTKTFKIEFEVNIVVIFCDGRLLTENFPIRLVREKTSL